MLIEVVGHVGRQVTDAGAETYMRLIREAGFELVAPDPELATEAGTVFLGRKP